MATPSATIRASVPNLVSVSSTGVQGNSNSYEPSISGDGRYVAFTSGASNFAAVTFFGHVYVRDRVLGTTTLVSTGYLGEANNGGHAPSISDDGRYIALASASATLAPGYANCTGFGICTYVFVRDTVVGVTTRVSRSTVAGTICGADRCPNGESDAPEISGDGRFVMYFSSATNLVTGDANACLPYGPCPDLLIYDRTLDTTAFVNVSSMGVQASAPPDYGGVSAVR